MQNEYLDGFQCLLPQTKRVLPSYQSMIGKKYGDLTVVKLLRKNNRNVLDCLCKCGKHQYLYRWQLKDRLSCTNCGKYTQQYMSQKEDLDVQFFNQLKQSNENFEISYKYANDLLKKQHHRCAYTGSILLAKNCILDKINPQKGFVKNNVQWISKQIGQMKGNMSNKQFLQICKKISVRNSILDVKPRKKEKSIQKLFL